MNQQLLVLIVVANVVLATASAARVMIKSERSLFRYRAWRIRDDLVDAVLDGRLSNRPVVQKIIGRTEVLVRASDVITPWNFFQAARLFRAAGHEPTPIEYHFLPADERAILDDAREQLNNARARLELLGSPSGWLVVVVLLVPAIFMAVGAAFRDGRERATVEEQMIIRARRSESRITGGSPVELLQPLACSSSGPSSYV